jgi:7-carboxy-7-deazaguanine synthase
MGRALGHVEVRDLCVGVDTGVGAPRPVHADVRSPEYPFQRNLQFALDRARPGAVRARRLHLPAFEESPQIRDLELHPHAAIMAALSFARWPHHPFSSRRSFAACRASPRSRACRARSFAGGKAMTVEDVVAEVERLGAPLVEITGGEPLEQEGFFALASALCDRGYTVLVETGGHVALDRVDGRVIKIVDVKCPGSGMEPRNEPGNLKLLGPRDEVKFVVADRADFEWAEAFVEKHRLDETNPVLISPVFEGARSPVAGEVAEWVRDSKRKLRLNLQIHKTLWGDVPGR